MKPTVSDVHVNRPLSNISVAFVQSATAFIADQIFPNVPVSKQSDTFYIYDRADMNRDEMAERAPATESVGGGYKVSPDGLYYCREYAFHKDIPDQLRANADEALNIDREATIYLTQKALIKREKLFVNSYFKAGVWTTDLTGVNTGPTGNQRLQWNDAASDPIMDVKRAKTEQLRLTGYEPNTLTIGRPVWDVLSEHPDVIDRIKYGQTPGSPAIVTRAAVAALMEVDRIVVANAVENTAAEGLALSQAFIAGKHALLAYVTPTPGLMTPTAGYTFSWTGMYGSSAFGTRIKTMRMDPLDSDRVQIQMCVDLRRVAADCGTFFSGIVA